MEEVPTRNGFIRDRDRLSISLGEDLMILLDGRGLVMYEDEIFEGINASSDFRYARLLTLDNLDDQSAVPESPSRGDRDAMLGEFEQLTANIPGYVNRWQAYHRHWSRS